MKPRVAPSCWLRFDLPIPTGFMQSKLTVIDFFDGAGGLSFGFARADFAVEVIDRRGVSSTPLWQAAADTREWVIPGRLDGPEGVPSGHIRPGAAVGGRSYPARAGAERRRAEPLTWLGA